MNTHTSKAHFSTQNAVPSVSSVLPPLGTPPTQPVQRIQLPPLKMPDSPLDKNVLEGKSYLSTGNLGIGKAAESSTPRKPKPRKSYNFTFTPTDKSMLELIGKHGMLTPRHIALGTGNRNHNIILKRLNALVENGLLRKKRLDRGIPAFELTRLGLEKIQYPMSAFRDWKKQSSWRHHLAEATVAIIIESAQLKNSFGDGFPKPILNCPYPLNVIGERVMRSKAKEALNQAQATGKNYYALWEQNVSASVTQAAHDGLFSDDTKTAFQQASESRAALGEYWENQAELFTHWDSARKFKKTHRPDLIIPMPLQVKEEYLLPNHVAVEIELSIKTRAEYRRILMQLLAHPLYGKVIYITDSEPIAKLLTSVVNELLSSGAFNGILTPEEMKEKLKIVRMHFLNNQADRAGFYG